MTAANVRCRTRGFLDTLMLYAFPADTSMEIGYLYPDVSEALHQLARHYRIVRTAASHVVCARFPRWHLHTDRSIMLMFSLVRMWNHVEACFRRLSVADNHWCGLCCYTRSTMAGHARTQPTCRVSLMYCEILMVCRLP